MTEEAVRRGAALLDKMDPAWWTKIDVGQLRMDISDAEVAAEMGAERAGQGCVLC